jgi:hypothetical protein
MTKKTSAELNRDISRFLATPATPASTPHSAKALATIRIMGTEPSQWSLTPIKWAKEEREVVGLVTCPTCRGSKSRWSPSSLDINAIAVP